MSECSVREADLAEMPAIVALVRSAFAESATWGSPSSALGETEGFWRSGIVERRFGVLVCEASTEIAGVVRHCAEPDGWWGFARLAVAPSYRRRGVATCLLAGLEKRAAMSGAAGIRCTARAEEGAGAQLYAAIGFSPAGTFDVVRDAVRIPVVRWEKAFGGGAPA